jgi:hypothetical protein
LRRQEFKVGDVVLHRKRKQYFYQPQTIGIIIKKHQTESNYPCWLIWGPDWKCSSGTDLAVQEKDLERLN